jgi:hypothetical protein
MVGSSADRDCSRRLIAERKDCALGYSCAADAAVLSRSQRLLRSDGGLSGLKGCREHCALSVGHFPLDPGVGFFHAWS